MANEKQQVAILVSALILFSGWAECSAQGFGGGPGPHGKGRGAQNQGEHQHGGPFGRMGGGPPGDTDFAADRAAFQYLLANHDKIRRKITNLENGVETLTESDDPDIAAKIREHASAMHKRVKSSRGIHLRDPLFAEIFRHSDQIEMAVGKTAKGVKVIETSDDPYLAKLIQAHARVVSKFVANGHEEVFQNHELPANVAAEQVQVPAVKTASVEAGKSAACECQQKPASGKSDRKVCERCDEANHAPAHHALEGSTKGKQTQKPSTAGNLAPDHGQEDHEVAGKPKSR